jgi:hypothetical protein
VRRRARIGWARGADGEAQADGQPLLQLPQKTIELVRIEFSKEEREVRFSPPGPLARSRSPALPQIYDSVERKARIRINRFMKRGTLLKKCVRRARVAFGRLTRLSCAAMPRCS